MIAADTNVLVRILVGDDPEQARLAREALTAAFEAGDACLVTDVVLAEIEWVLESCYGASRSDVAEAVGGLLGQADFAFEDRARVERALETYRRNRLDFSDALIAEAARAHGARTTLTFEKRLRRVAGFTLLG